MSDQTYNGWTNYPTWAVNLWLANDEGLCREALDMAQEAVDDHGKADATYPLARRLEEWVTDDLSPDLGATFAADLYGYAIGCVNWHEIAESWVDDIEETDDEAEAA